MYSQYRPPGFIMKKKKPNAGKALTAEKREELYQVFFEHGTVNSVIKKCKIHIQTALKYKKLDKWVDRVERTKAKAETKTDNSNAKRLTRNRRLLDNAISIFSAALIGKIKCEHCGGDVKIPKMKPKFGDIEKLLKLELILSGDIPIEEIIYIRLKNLPDSLLR